MDSVCDLPRPLVPAVWFTQLDVLRAAAVFAAACSQIVTGATEANLLLGIHWVPQYISLISGVGFAVGRNSFAKSATKLILLFAIGMLLNAVPLSWRYATGREILSKADVEHGVFRIFLGVVWQFVYVIVLLLGMIIMYPLKIARRRKEFLRVSLFVGILTCGAAIWAIIGPRDCGWEYGARRGVNELPIYACHLQGSLVIATANEWYSARPALAQSLDRNLSRIRARFPSPRRPTGKRGPTGSYTGWILMAYIYGLLVIMEVKAIGQYFILVQLMLLGFVLYKSPLRHRDTLQRFVINVWPFCIMALALLAHNLKLSQGTPSTGAWDRFRFALSTMGCVALFAILWAPSIDETTDSPAQSLRMGGCSKNTVWIRAWSCLVYVTHWALWDVATIVVPQAESNYGAQIAIVTGFLVSAAPLWLVSKTQREKEVRVQPRGRRCMRSEPSVVEDI